MLVSLDSCGRNDAYSVAVATSPPETTSGVSWLEAVCMCVCVCVCVCVSLRSIDQRLNKLPFLSTSVILGKHSFACGHHPYHPYLHCVPSVGVCVLHVCVCVCGGYCVY